MESIDRRQFLRLAAAGGATFALGRYAAFAAEEGKKIRIGFVGVGSRGTGLLKQMLLHPEVEVPAICDIDENHLNAALAIVEKALGKKPEGFSKGPEDFKRMVVRDDIDAVLVATPPEFHAPVAVASMNAGKAVGSEVPACVTLDECWELVETQKKTGATYMLLENYCYSKPVMQVLSIVQAGLFGDLTYGEGSYIHEVRSLKYTKDGSALTWRGKGVAEKAGNVYPTHAMGPVCQWMEINKKDRLTTLVAMDSKSAAPQQWAARKFGPDSVAAKTKILSGDVSQVLIRTEKGRMIRIHYDTSSPRPGGNGQYSLQGTTGSYLSSFGQHKVYFEGRSPEGVDPEKFAEQEHGWQELAAYENEFKHPYWRDRGTEAQKAGHGGGDFFVVTDFLDAIRTKKSPIDVVDAATWTVVRPLSAESVAAGGKPMDVPDFSKPRPA
ncbi:MAG: Gfo/Idh/MocA family protein [Candidatus Sumerlaeaceae bacterium]